MKKVVNYITDYDVQSMQTNKDDISNKQKSTTLDGKNALILLQYEGIDDSQGSQWAT